VYVAVVTVTPILVTGVQGMTMLIVTHEMGFAAHVADRIPFIDEVASSTTVGLAACSTKAPNRACGSSCRPSRSRQLLAFEGMDW
jgi:ABC-type polar amino acid transport system ATPase subunit